MLLAIWDLINEHLEVNLTNLNTLTSLCSVNSIQKLSFLNLSCLFLSMELCNYFIFAEKVSNFKYISHMDSNYLK